MHKLMKWIFMGTVLLGLCGCLQTTDEFYINPDGSGKVIHEALLTPVDIGSGLSMTPEEKLNNIVQDELERARGVDAWKDISYDETQDADIR